MKDKKYPMTDKEFINFMVELFNEVDLESQEIDEALREFGYDPDKVAKRMRDAATQALAEALLNLNER